ncbi:aminotransferase class V-fold PLP-dependent enzyme [Paenirhodobacter sp.]|uniref:aminotransferase class V-fold PLP-dependent enzyme n=1 Tax=Paenirhodobacter sp. TaxID=1965326 RepID=UPI003B40BC16
MPIYLNAGGHGLPSAETLERQRSQLQAEIRDGTVAAAEGATAAVAQVRTCAARLLGTGPARIALGNTTSQFWLAALARLPLARRRVLVAPHEWGSHVRYLQQIAPDLGLTLEPIPEAEAMDPSAWAARMDQDLAAIVLPHVTSVQGLIYPVAEIGALPRPDTTLLVVDAAQSVGRVPATLPELNCDVLVATARKWLRGPRATAMMALSPRAEVLLGRAATIEPMDANVMLRLGMGAALAQTLDQGVTAIAAELSQISETFRDTLGQHAELAQWLEAGTPAVRTAPGHITLSVPAARCAAVDARLTAAGIRAKWANPAGEEPLSAAANGSRILRITPHQYNTAADAKALAAALTG